MPNLLFRALAVLLVTASCAAQHSGMEHSGHDQHMAQEPASPTLLEVVAQHAISGTDVEPASTPMHMIMRQHGGWMLMFHGEAFLTQMQQTGPRGADKLFAANWAMVTAQRTHGKGTLTLKGMLSLEPTTISGKRYPELFQQGETAYGKPIVDGQHPHDFVSELAVAYDYGLSERTALSFYLAPVGSPSLGPPAYPHRESASEDPIAPLGHHFEDSTHVVDEVITLGVTHRFFRLEASGFHGREPDEYRWDIDAGTIDSWSTRATINPAPNWSLQYSIAQLHSPEELSPGEDVRRMTASIVYNRPLRRGNWATLGLWGRNQGLEDRNVGNAYLLESTLRFLDRNNLWTRFENADRTNELLLANGMLPPGFTERYFARVQAYTAGYDREIAKVSHVSTALGLQMTWYGVPVTLKSEYGQHPFGVAMFLRVRAY